MANQEHITLMLLLWDLNTLCRELLLASFLYIPNAWKCGVISLSDTVKFCCSSEIPPPFTYKSTLQITFKLMSTGVVLVTM